MTATADGSAVNNTKRAPFQHARNQVGTTHANSYNHDQTGAAVVNQHMSSVWPILWMLLCHPTIKLTLVNRFKADASSQVRKAHRSTAAKQSSTSRTAKMQIRCCWPRYGSTHVHSVRKMARHCSCVIIADLQWTPSQLIAGLHKPTLHAPGWRPKPQIVELLSTDPVSGLPASVVAAGMCSSTSARRAPLLTCTLTMLLQVQSSVNVDQPLFQPFPPEVVFHSYEPFGVYQAVLRLRNNDKVCNSFMHHPWNLADTSRGSCTAAATSGKLPGCNVDEHQPLYTDARPCFVLHSVLASTGGAACGC